jgi:hypothetical protein
MVEIGRIADRGFELVVDGERFFLAYADYPWFRDASEAAIRNVVSPGRGHLHWPDLDVDLSVAILRHPGRFPLQDRGSGPRED